MILKKFISEKFFLPSVAVFFAIALWVYVLSSESSHFEKNYAIEFRPPKGLISAVDLPREMNVTLKGPRAFVRSILESEDKIIIDINEQQQKKIGKNTYQVKIRDEDVPVPFGVSIVRIKKTQFLVRLEKEATKTIKITPAFFGKINSMHKLVESRIIPDHVAVSGPEKDIENVTEVRTVPIDLTDLESSGSKEVQLASPGDLLHLDKERVEFEYEIRARTANVVLKDVKIRFLTSKRIKKTSHRTVKLFVWSEKGDKIKVKSRDVEVLANIPEQKSGQVDVVLEVDLPKELHLLRIEPEKIFVTVQ